MFLLRWKTFTSALLVSGLEANVENHSSSVERHTDVCFFLLRAARHIPWNNIIQALRPEDRSANHSVL